MQFAQPIYLYFVPLAILLLIVFFVYAERRMHARLRRFAAPQLAASLIENYSRRRRIVKNSLLTLGAALVLIALARPQVGFVWEESEARGIDVVFALDTSRSMLAEDVKPSRLERSKLAILDLTEQMRGDRVGLVAFAGDAFLQCPLTLDFDAFRQTLESLDTNTIPIGGTDIAAALEEASAAFGDENNFRIVVLITDGEDLEASGIAAARELAANGTRVFAVGVGSTRGELIPIRDQRGELDYLRDPSGELVRTRLDEETLMRIAAASDGAYVPFGSSGQGLEQVYAEVLEQIPEEELGTRLQRIPLERFQWPLLAALIFLVIEVFIGTRRRFSRAPASSGMALLFGALVLGSLPAPVDAATTEALKLYEKGAYEASIEAWRAEIEETPEDARLHYNLGNAYYRAEQMTEAIAAYREALNTRDVDLQAKVFFNLGNAYYEQGLDQLELNPVQTRELWDEALRSYENVMELQPDEGDASVNANFVRAQIRAITRELDLIAAPPEGGRVNGGGFYVRGQTVPIEATANDGWRFGNWEGEGVADSEKAKTSVDMTDNRRLRANFIKTWHLEVVSLDPERGTAGTSGVYDEGTDIEITAEANDYYAFKRWISDAAEIADSSAAQTTVQIFQDARVEAEFVDAFRLSASVDPAIGGFAQPDGFFEVNTEQPIQAQPREGFEWVGWIGDGIADPAAPQTTVLLNQDKAPVAKMNRVWSLIAIPDKPESGTVATADGTPGGDYPVGTTVAVSATPNENFKFVRWEGPGVEDPSAAETFVTVQSEEHDLIAIFESDQQDDQNQDQNQNQQDQNQDQQNQDQQQDQQQDSEGDPQEQPEEPQDQESGEEEPEPQDGEEPQESEPQSEQPEPAGQEPQEEPGAEEVPEARVPGQMTREEAAQLLNALRESEKKLPVKPKKSKEGEPVGRDW